MNHIHFDVDERVIKECRSVLTFVMKVKLVKSSEDPDNFFKLNPIKMSGFINLSEFPVFEEKISTPVWRAWQCVVPNNVLDITNNRLLFRKDDNWGCWDADFWISDVVIHYKIRL